MVTFCEHTLKIFFLPEGEPRRVGCNAMVPRRGDGQGAHP